MVEADSDERQRAAFREDESLAVSRKKTLLRILALRECERLGIALGPEASRDALEGFRERFGLERDEELDAWLESAGLERAELERFVREITLVDALEACLDEAIVRELPVQRAACSLYSWRGETWVQFNVELCPDGEGRAVASAVRIFDALLPLVDPATRPDAVLLFFAVRKPPGLRLRVAGRRSGPVREIVGGALDALRSEGAVVRWWTVPYEPEAARFGGDPVMDVVHRWFETDSLCWFRFEALEARKENTLGRELLSVVVLNDLFFTTLRDDAEVWDVWRRLALRHGATDLRPEAGVPDVPVVSIDEILSAAGPAEREILLQYRLANVSLAEGLGRSAQEGGLRIGPRSLLATLALFHWNRLGFSSGPRQIMFGAMLKALYPHLPPEGNGQTPAGSRPA